MITYTVEPIKAYSIQHLLMGIGLIALAVVLVYFLKKLKKTTVIISIGIALVIIEVLKQIFMQQVYIDYSWSDIPFQLCSVPMYLCLAYPFFKKGRETIENFLKSFGIVGAVVAFAVPYDVFSPFLVMSIQSIVWHEMLLILGVYCIAATDKEKKIGAKDFLYNALLYLALAAIAILINALLKDVSAGTSNMFFIGPSKAYVIILEDIYDKCGWVVESIVMICVSEAAAAIVLIAGELVRRSIYRFRKND